MPTPTLSGNFLRNPSCLSSSRASPLLIWLMGLCLLLSMTLAWAAPGWSTASSLQNARSAHTTTLLPNGKVLAMGGFSGSVNPITPELYDPTTNAWSAASLVSARSAHTATLLPNGKVLVAGGADNSSFLASALLYDPATNAWTAAGSLAAVRYSHTATLLPNGNVLLAAGIGNSSYLASAELYRAGSSSSTIPILQMLLLD